VLPPIAVGSAQSASGNDDSVVISGGVQPRPAQAAPANDAPQTHRALASTSGDSSIYLPSVEQEAVSQVEVFAGTPINAQLDDQIVSTLPASAIFGHVTHDVRASLKPYPIVIPRGSRLRGHYDNNIAGGENRVLVTWDTIIMPDGRTFELRNMGASETDGSAGLNAKVDDHAAKIYTTVFVASVLEAGLSAVGASHGNNNIIYNPAQQTATTAGDKIVDQTLAQQPTLTVTKGRLFVIKLAATAIMDPYYEKKDD
jgi:type IV secretion system protein VirB10